MDTSRPFCRRCYLEELGTEQEIHNMQDYIALVEPEQRAQEDTYRARLEACARCPFIMHGICRLCGCFVELRAARASLSCPGTPRRW